MRLNERFKRRERERDEIETDQHVYSIHVHSPLVVYVWFALRGTDYTSKHIIQSTQTLHDICVPLSIRTRV